MFADVLVNLPVDRPFTYAVPPGTPIERGSRVVVPFRGKPVGGFVLRLTDEAPKFAAQDVYSVGDTLIDDQLFDLARWIADRYACAWGEALEATVPTGVKKHRASRTITVARLAGPAELSGIRSPKQRRVVELLSESGRLSVPELAKRLGERPQLGPLVRKGLVLTEQVAPAIDVMADAIREAPKEITLTAEQREALAIAESNAGGVTLIHGVTGSGKTEVYLGAIDRVVRAGKQAIVLVPEIALTPQTVARFRARFPRVAVLHSVLTEGDRASQWRLTRSGEADVIIGARSAIFAPTRALGLVVIDEEHEGAYKQESTPRYHAREVAIERARREGAGVILGSATPSLESLFRARRGDYRLAVLPNRIEKLPMPRIEVIDMVAERAELKRYPILSRQLVKLMQEAVSRGEQAILFLNRRGFVTQFACPRCKWVFRCRRCDVAMTHHRDLDRCLCHYCFAAKPVPEGCPDCRAGGLLRLGIGTERIEEEVKTLFPDRRVARMDSDSMKSRKDYRESLGGLWSGRTDILIGTQMIAKGLDVPNVTLVGVVNADTAFHVPDFRAAERTFQLITQVAGRAGRGPRGGRVVVQSFNPNHYAVTTAAAYDFEGFAARELDMRRELDYPPFSQLVRVVLLGTNEKKTREAAERFASKLAAWLPPTDRMLGPAEAPLFRLKGRFRIHLLLKTKDLAAVRTRLMQLAHAVSRPLQCQVDVDPVNML